MTMSPSAQSATAGRRWIAVGAAIALVLPWIVPRGGDTDYLYFGAVAAFLATVLFLPGYAWRQFRPQSSGAEAAILPVPGILILASAGLASWIAGPSIRP